MQNLRLFIRRYAQSLLAGIYFFCGGAFLKRHRSLLYTICDHFGFEGKKHPLPPMTVPQGAIDDFTGSPCAPVLYELQQADGNVTPLELLVITGLVRRLAPEKCFEIGTFDGRTTLNIAANIPETGHVYTLDLPQEEKDKAALTLEEGDSQFIDKPVSGARFKGHSLSSKITQLFGDSARFDYSPYLRKMDFIFIDGAHSYEYVLCDTRWALQMLNPQGGGDRLARLFRLLAGSGPRLE